GGAERADWHLSLAILALMSHNATMLDAKQIAQIVRTQDRDQAVSQSTLHYYVQVGILPPAVGRGRSGYTPEHLARFRLARLLKPRSASLAEIRERLGGMTSEEVAAELAAVQGEPSHELRMHPAQAAFLVRDSAAAGSDDTGSRYAIAEEALRARGGET